MDMIIQLYPGLDLKFPDHSRDFANEFKFKDAHGFPS